MLPSNENCTFTWLISLTSSLSGELASTVESVSPRINSNWKIQLVHYWTAWFDTTANSLDYNGWKIEIPSRLRIEKKCLLENDGICGESLYIEIVENSWWILIKTSVQRKNHMWKIYVKTSFSRSLTIYSTDWKTNPWLCFLELTNLQKMSCVWNLWKNNFEGKNVINSGKIDSVHHECHFCLCPIKYKTWLNGSRALSRTFKSHRLSVIRSVHRTILMKNRKL